MNQNSITQNNCWFSLHVCWLVLPSQTFEVNWQAGGGLAGPGWSCSHVWWSLVRQWGTFFMRSIILPGLFRGSSVPGVTEWKLQDPLRPQLGTGSLSLLHGIYWSKQVTSQPKCKAWWNRIHLLMGEASMYCDFLCNLPHFHKWNASLSWGRCCNGLPIFFNILECCWHFFGLRVMTSFHRLSWS